MEDENKTTDAPSGEIEVSMAVSDRADLAMKVGNYIRARTEFEQASNSYQNACTNLRESKYKPENVVVRYSYNYHLLSFDKDGNFEVNEIESI